MTDFKEAVEILRNKLKPRITRINTLKDEYDGYVFSLHLKNYFNALDPIYTTRSDDDLMQMMLDQKAELIHLRDKYKMLEEFIDNNIQVYQEIVDFAAKTKPIFLPWMSITRFVAVTFQTICSMMMSHGRSSPR